MARWYAPPPPPRVTRFQNLVKKFFTRFQNLQKQKK